MMITSKNILLIASIAITLLLIQICIADTKPPVMPVKLIFIHHSVGENWLADENGGLGKSLLENNYFVSDTYYGWGPGNIGDRTDIPDWIEWFSGPQSSTYIKALYSESKGNAAGYDYYGRQAKDPGGENEIVIFKSCFPNSELGGNPDDPAGDGADMTVSGAKYVYNQILPYFSQHPEKLFIAITPPPSLSPEHAAQAEAFSRWLTTEWLSEYKGNNIGVFDLHAVLSSPENHHTAEGSEIVYSTDHGNTLAYPTEDAHPSAIGNRKATKEFVPLLNYYYNRWKSGQKGTDLTSRGNDEGNSKNQTLVPSVPETRAPEPMVMHNPESEGKERDKTGTVGEWVTYSDEMSEITLINSSPLNPCIHTRVQPAGWTSLETLFPSPRDWSDYSGISFHINTDRPALRYSIALYTITGEYEKTGFHKSFITLHDTTQSGETITVPFNELEAMEGVGRFDPSKAGGFFFSFGSDREEEATVCISEITLI